ncbi:unnamed protein product [Zymoseptoria tritici ST99CH_3D7]|uniref:Uncharacterized protein n=1 Tax=Zymoseptoria tritici (strain ST99CH_3D7) TaxID=1276538 RepID=A0A1X7RK17_ZYMT9|nr:unnamed protein product [Zymoseptoria tritici ST99CH_3D7]
MDINQHDGFTFWNRPDIVDSLKAVYGDVYDAIESDLIHIRILMTDLCERLGLGHIIEASELGNPSRPQTRHPSLKSTLRSRWVYSQSGKEIQNLVLQLDSRQQSIRGTLDDLVLIDASDLGSLRTRFHVYAVFNSPYDRERFRAGVALQPSCATSCLRHLCGSGAKTPEMLVPGSGNSFLVRKRSWISANV